MKRINKFFSRLMWHFDRVFGDNKRIGWQIFIIMAVIGVLVTIVGVVGCALTGCYNVHKDLPIPIIQAIGLVFGASNLPPNEVIPIFPLWWQVIAFLLGAVLFSGVTITFVGNLLGNRQEAYRNGSIRYSFFENHMLFLGGSRIILPMLKEIGEDANMKGLHVLVLTSDNVETVRADIRRGLPSKLLQEMKITVLFGNHYDGDTLESMCAGKARKLFIVGDYLSGSEHDSENVACWEAVRSLCENRKNVPCCLYFSRTSSLQLFRYRKDSRPSCLDTIALNFFETVAQRVLVHNGTINSIYPALDRKGIGPEDDRRVHLVLTGATSVSYAMATTAAHLCHFPNSVDPTTFNIVPSNRTKITFIAPNIKEEMYYITSHLYFLFKLSHYTYIKNKIEKPHMPESKYGDFLDIEWEFLDGSTADDWVMERLRAYYLDCVEAKRTYLTVAFCGMEADRNIAAATYMPSEYHRIVLDKDGKLDYEQTIPLLVFQPKNEKLVHDANRFTRNYQNLFSFGSQRESYDPSIQKRIDEGKRVNYIRIKGEEYQQMTQNQNELDDEWRKKNYMIQMSNVYCANHVGVKLRSAGMDVKALGLGAKISEEYVEQMSIVEHNRYNMEKLLTGFDPKYSGNSLDGNGRLEKEKGVADKPLSYHGVVPYKETTDEYRKYTCNMIRHIADVIREPSLAKSDKCS